jgi:LacI family transcriptional regulator
MPVARKRLQRDSPEQVSLIDVAAKAGCSTASVSRVLNQPASVKEALRNRVQAAMRELGYVPNSAARALRSRRTHIMGIVIPTLGYAIYARLVEGLQQRLLHHGYSLLVATSEYDLVAEEQHARVLLERGVEGLVLVGDAHAPELYRALESSGVPYVNTYVYRSDEQHPCVGFDNRRSTAEVTEFLLQLGHRCFGVISAITVANDRASERVAGVREALESHGLKLPADAVYERPYSISSGREGFRYLRALSAPPTAIVCGNDILAIGALMEARTSGVRVPDDVSIVGFDNLELAANVEPPLTTVDVPAAEMGERAADFLAARIAGQPVLRSLQIKPTLLVRGTSGRAPSQTLQQQR